MFNFFKKKEVEILPDLLQCPNCKLTPIFRVPQDGFNVSIHHFCDNPHYDYVASGNSKKYLAVNWNNKILDQEIINNDPKVIDMFNYRSFK